MEKKNVLYIALAVILIIVVVANVVIALVVNNADDGAVTDADRLEKYLSRQGFGDMPLTSVADAESYLRRGDFSKKSTDEEDVTEYFRKTLSGDKASVIVIKNFDSDEAADSYYGECVESAPGSLFRTNGAFVYEEQSAGVKTSGSFLLRGNTVYSTMYYVKDSAISTIRNLSAASYDRAGIAEYLIKHGYEVVESTDDYDVYNKDYGEYLSARSRVTVYKNKGEDFYNELKYASASYKLSDYPDFSVVGNIARDRLFLNLGGNGCALISSASENVVIKEETESDKTASEYLTRLGTGDFLSDGAYESVEKVKEYALKKGCILDSTYTDSDGKTVSLYSDSFAGLYTFPSDDDMSEFLAGYAGENVLSSREAEIIEYDSEEAAAAAISGMTVGADETLLETSVNGKVALYIEYMDANDDYVNGELVFAIGNATISLRYKTASAERAELMRSVSGVENLDYTRDGFVASLGNGFSASERRAEYVKDSLDACSVEVIEASATVGATLKLTAFYTEDSDVAEELFGDVRAAYEEYLETSASYDVRLAEKSRNSYYYVKGSDGDGVEPELFVMHVKDGSKHVILLIGYVTDISDVASAVL